MKILLTNDDGIHAEGIQAVAKELRKLGEVTIVAPERQRSALSHSITLYDPLIIHKLPNPAHGIPSFSINGTPVDSVKLAMRELLTEPPDLVVSGINKGLNTGSNVLYSGTVAAALEATLFDVTAVALSLENKSGADFARAARSARKVVEYVIEHHLKSSVAFNVNYPAKKSLRGVLVTRTEPVPFEDVYDRRRDLIGRTYFWIKGSVDHANHASSDGVDGLHSDVWAVGNGYVSITPLKRDLTDRHSLAALRAIPKNILRS